jgi:hypothetical protein
LRAAGIDYDVRVMNPYSSYEDFEFTVPVGTSGDTYFAGTLSLNTGDLLTFRTNVNLTLQNSTEFHWLEISSED